MEAIKKRCQDYVFAAIRLVLMGLGVSVVGAFAQQYPATMYMPVTFYDYHANLSNPEFEPDHFGALKKNMVRDTLNAQKKPILGSSPFFNYYIDKWFKPWTPGDFTIPRYTDKDGTYGGKVTVNYDTAFKNIVIKDSLPFKHAGNGVYLFDRSSHDNQLFWLDRKGFGEEPANSGHNFGFTMELHTVFTYQRGLKFDFLGDDDVWAFVNGRLAMDLGGIHGAAGGSINMDSLAQKQGLVEGQKYAFDFFYAERHTNQSNIKITTNIFSPPAFLRIYTQPGTPDAGTNLPIGSKDTVLAGQPLNLYAHAFDSTQGWRPEWDTLVTWRMVDSLGNPIISKTSGSSTTLTPTEAYGTITLTATFTNPDDPTATPTVISVQIYVAPGKADHITLQTSPDITNYRNDDNISEITIPEKEASAVVYAVVRDSCGNFIRFATSATWQSGNLQVVTANPTTGKQSTITKKSGGSTTVVVSEPNVKPATLNVTSLSASVNLLSAKTLDTDGDGYLDHITLEFDSVVTIPSAISSIIAKVVFQGTNFPIETIVGENNSQTGTKFTITLTEQVTKELQTGWLPLFTLSGVSNVPTISYTCKDGAGAVVKQALYYQGQMSSGSSDTLRISLSETVLWPSTQNASVIFNYFKSGTKYDAAFKSMTIENNVAVVILSDDFQPNQMVDSVQLASSSGVNDLSVNPPPANGRKAPVEYGHIEIRLIPSANPFTPGVTQLPRVVADRYAPVIAAQTKVSPSGIPSSSGTIVAIDVRGKPLKMLSDGSFGKGIIYDAVGNVVVSDRKITKSTGRDYAIFWDGRNQNGRIVGAGAYLLVVTTTDIDGKTKVEKMKLGIRR